MPPDITRWISVNSRRLYVFKQAFKDYADDMITVNVLRDGEIADHFPRTLTTFNYGRDVEVR